MSADKPILKPEPIQIAGGGIAGLSTAIHLACRGHRVELYEKNADSGQNRSLDWDAAENWTTKQDLRVQLDHWGLSLNFSHHPISEFVVCDYQGRCYPIITTRPLFYLVSRGPQSGSLEQSLKAQALDYGVNIHYNHMCQKDKVDVWAAGIQQKGFFLSVGVTFCTSHPDIVMVFVNAETAPKAYAYLIIAQGRAKLSVVLTRNFLHARRLLSAAISMFRSLHPFNMDDVRFSSGYGGDLGSFLNRSVTPISVGEAAGFQDYLWGFGIRYALFSGYLAAKAIDQGLDYCALTNTHIQPLVRSSLINRYLYDRVGNRTYQLLIKRFSRSRDLTSLLRRWYSGSAMAMPFWFIISGLYR